MTWKKEAELNAEHRSFPQRFAQRLHNLHSTVPCYTDVEHVDGLIFLPKKAFNSFCTWMLLPTVRYTPSCVAPKMKTGGGVKAVRGDEGEHNLDNERGVEMYHAENLPESGQRCKCILSDLAPLDWSGRGSNGKFMGKVWVMELEKGVPAVELMAVVVASNILPARATSETLFYRNVRLKRTRLAPIPSFIKSLFDRQHLFPFKTDGSATRVVWQGCFFLFFLSGHYFASVASNTKSVTQLRPP